MCFESTSSSTQNTQNTLPGYLEQAGQGITDEAMNAIWSHPYQGYTGPTEAKFGPTFQTAENAATARSGATDPNFQAGTDALKQGLGLAGNTAGASVSSLMSPYTQAVLDPTIDAIHRQAAQTNQGLATNATMAGAFGDTGYGTQKANNDYNTTQAIAGATGTAYNNAYNSALSTQQNALSQLLGGVGQASGLGSSSNTAQTNLEQLLGSLGATRQAAGQTGINTAINVNNQNQMGYLQQLGLAAGAMNTAPHDTTSATQGTQTQPNNMGFGLLGSLLGGL